MARRWSPWWAPLWIGPSINCARPIRTPCSTRGELAAPACRPRCWAACFMEPSTRPGTRASSSRPSRSPAVETGRRGALPYNPPGLRMMTILWWHWLVLGLLLAVAELATAGGFYLLFFGIGALLVGGLAGLGLVTEAWL